MNGDDNKRWMATDDIWQEMTIMTNDGRWRTAIIMDNNGNSVIKQSAFASSVTMVCKREERNFFLLFRVFFFNSFFRFFNRSCSLFLWSFMQRIGKNGNRIMIFEEMKKAKCLSIQSSSNKLAWKTKVTKKLKHKRKRRKLIWIYISA